MNRRGFLGLLGATVAVLPMAASASTPPMVDDFVYRGRQIRWCDWREPANQAIAFGYWMAIEPEPHYFTYSTTIGGLRPYTAHELDCIDMEWARREGWPSPAAMLTATPAERDAVKRRALDVLLESL